MVRLRLSSLFGLLLVVLMGGYIVQCGWDDVGGAPCEYNVQCGDLPANAIELRRTGFSAPDMLSSKDLPRALPEGSAVT